MKKHFLLFSLLIISIAIFAEPVDTIRAMQIAQKFVPKQQPSAHGHHAPAAQMGEIVYTHYMPKSGKPALYVVNIGNAFAIVSADDVAHPILGYNYNKSWPTDGNIPPQVKSFFDDLAQQMETASEHPQDAETAEEWLNPRKAPNRAKVNDNLPDSVGPLLTTTWDQGQYYNALCPEDSQSPYDGHVLTGCVATAMAQIIAYWGKKETLKTRGTHSYNTDFYGGTYGELSVDFKNTTYDFTHMPDALTSESAQEEINAVAKLMYECGVAVNMMYGTGASGAYDVDARAALINFFLFSPDASFAESVNFSNEEWRRMLKEDLAAGKPIYYSGRNNFDVGHAFVCNGYQKDGYFYFNFGWGGYADGWFLTSATMGYTINQAALFGGIPDSKGNIILGQTNGYSSFIVDEPLELHHTMGYNKYPLTGTCGSCGDRKSFLPIDKSKQIVADIIRFEDHMIEFYDGLEIDGHYIRTNDWHINRDYSPIVSSLNALTVNSRGYATPVDFEIQISQSGNCRMVSNPIYTVDVSKINLSWTENGNAIQWQVEYGESGFNQGEGNLSTVNEPNIELTGLTPYKDYDLYIRSLCCEDNNQWLHLCVTPKESFWTDVVTEQPEGYIEDEDGNVTISSAEGLAWLSVLVNGLHGNPVHYFWGKTITLTEDIDLSGHRWMPIGMDGLVRAETSTTYFAGIFQGNNHIVSNLYIHDGGLCMGLFGYIAYGAMIKNLILSDGMIYNQNNGEYGGCALGGTGGLVGLGEQDVAIINCCSYVSIMASNKLSGSLCGRIFDPEKKQSIILNCSGHGNVYGKNFLGGLVGTANNTLIQNSYARGNVYITEYIREPYLGGLIASLGSSSRAENCYSTGKGKVVDNPQTDLRPINTIEDAICQYVYGSDIDFHTSEDSFNQQIMTPYISIQDSTYEDLLSTLNGWVTFTNDSSVKTWIRDTANINNGYPIFGKNFSPLYYNPSNVIASNATQVGDTNVKTKISWHQKDNPDHWEILYVYPHQNIESGTIIETNTNPCVLTSLPVGDLLNISVRAIYENGVKSGWSTPIQYIPDKLRWTEVVTAQPDGYQEDEEGNVYISTAEGLAWLSSLTNELNGVTYDEFRFYGKKIELMADIDLSAYRWTAIGCDYHALYACTFEGNGHVISGLYCNENTYYQGLFGLVHGIIIRNLTIRNGKVRGTFMCALIAGSASKYIKDMMIYNCIAEGEVCGLYEAGGIVGSSNWNIIYNTAFIGKVSSRDDVTDPLWGQEYLGGIIGHPNAYTIANTYVAAEISDVAWSGLVIGWGAEQILFDNVYALSPSNSLPISYSNFENNSSFFSGSGTSWNLNNPPYINGAFHTDLVDALNAWVDANNSEGIYRYWVADTENINGGFPIFDSNDNPTPTDINNINQQPIVNSLKLIKDGQILIIRGDNTYTVMGQEINVP